MKWNRYDVTREIVRRTSCGDWLSALLIGPFGLVGVAVGTLVPLALASMLAIFPAACRRVDLPIGQAVRHSVWPAAWPAVVVAGALAGTARISSGTLLAVLLQVGAAGLVYLALFFGLAIGRRDRAAYTARLRSLFASRRGLASAA